MVKYHGTPIGGSKRDAALFLQGRNALISFATKGHIPEVLECCDSFCLDNGAFTIWKKGEGEIDIPAYLEWAESLSKHPAFDFAIIPDVIMGSEEENDLVLENYQWDTNKWIPVYHLGESVERFKRLSEMFPRVALGSTDKWKQTGSRDWWKNMANFMDAICDDYGIPPAKLHGLRMLNYRVFEHLPLSSADSSNAAVNGHIAMKKGPFPSLERWQGNERIARRTEGHSAASFWSRDSLIKTGLMEAL